MTSVLSTNAKPLFDVDGDFMGYGLPDADPVAIRTKFVTAHGDSDELVYVVTWAGGVWAEMFTFKNDWHDIYLATINSDRAQGLRKLDAAIAAVAKPLPRPANIVHEAA